MDKAKIIAIALIAIAVVVFAYILFTFYQGEGGAKTSTSPPIHNLTKPPKPKPKPKPKPPSPQPPGSKPSPSPARTERTPPTRTETHPGTETAPTYDTGFFRYSLLKYRVTVRGSEAIYTLENLGEESVNGRMCYHQRITIEGPQQVEQEIWYDKTTGDCVKIVVKVAGREVEVPCSQRAQPDQGGQFVTPPAKIDGEFRYVGDERISVPAGTFDCYVFEGEGFKSWIAKEGLLVKWTFPGGEGVLLEYRG